MKKRVCFICSLVLLVLGILYLQLGRNPKVNHTLTHTHAEGYDLSLVVTANKICIFNRTELQKDLLQKTLENQFKDVYFSYDILGKPDTITITVYSNRLMRALNVTAFQINYDTKTDRI